MNLMVFSNAMSRPIRLLLGLLVGTVGCCMAQTNTVYAPAKLTREVPAEVRTDLGQSAKGTLRKMGKSSLSQEEKVEFAYGVARDVRSFHLSSYLIYEGLIYDYVNKVTDHVLKGDPEMRSKIRVYVSRSTSVNALTFPDGSIFVNLGLLARLQNEAQLAFVLCHEIVHFKEQHGLRRMEKGKEVRISKDELKKAFEGTGNPEKLLSLFRFSRENETDADSMGMEMFLTTEYDPQAAGAALELLRESDVDMEQENVNLYRHFQQKEFVIDTSWIRAFTREELLAMQEKADSEANGKPANTITSGRAGKRTSKIEKSDLATHPDIEVRITAIKAQMERQQKPSRNKGQLFLQPAEAFATLRDHAQCESLISWEARAAYGWTLYSALKKFETQPDNVFLIERAATNLFWIYVSSLTTHANGVAVLDHYRTGNPGYANLLYFLKKAGRKKLGNLSMAFFESYHEEFPKSETLLILQGRLASAIGDAKLAKEKYTDYLAQFPNGIHSSFATYQKRNAQ